MVEFSANGSYLIAGGFLKIWDINNPSAPVYRSIEQGLEYANATVLNADISNNGRYVAAIAALRLDIYDIQARGIIKTIRGATLAAVAFGPDNQLAYASSNGSLKIYDIKTQKTIYSRKFKNIKPLRIAWSPSGKFLALGGRGDNVVLFNLADKSVTATMGIGNKWVSDLEFSPDNKYLAIATRSGSVRIIDTESGNELANWLAHKGATFALDFHPGGKYLATGGVNRLIAIWKVPGWELVTSWMAHDKAVSALSFSPDGRMLASGCANTPMGGVSDTRIWELDNNFKNGILASDNRPERQNLEQTKVHNPVVSQATEKDLSTNIVLDQKRLALLIGNGLYQSGGILANPENDANDIAARLQALGFDVMLYNNLDQKGFKKAIDDFGARLSTYDVGLFYYAGHGIQVKGNNYLIPVDANLKSENDVEYDCVNAGRLLAKMEDAGSTTNIIILDACRDNPFERSWRRSTHGSGLAFMTAPAGSLISYATSPGATASDGSGHNGLFTTALLQYMEEANLSVLEMFQKVRTYVRQNSNGEQVPWESTSLEGNFYFKQQ